MVRLMANEELVQAVKKIVTIARSGNLDDAYLAYKALFDTPAFLGYRPEDQRQALRLMILAKNAPRTPTPAMVEAHRAALPALTELVSSHQEPADHEMLGICHVILGNEQSASAIFRAGLAIERERSPGSDLCGELMKRISMI
jgi:hypothetical protein